MPLKLVVSPNSISMVNPRTLDIHLAGQHLDQQKEHNSMHIHHLLLENKLEVYNLLDQNIYLKVTWNASTFPCHVCLLLSQCVIIHFPHVSCRVIKDLARPMDTFMYQTIKSFTYNEHSFQGTTTWHKALKTQIK